MTTCPGCHRRIPVCCHCGGEIRGEPHRTPDGKQAHRGCAIEVRERGYRPEARQRLTADAAHNAP
jgi:hypothetical protein